MIGPMILSAICMDTRTAEAGGEEEEEAVPFVLPVNIVSYHSLSVQC